MDSENSTKGAVGPDPNVHELYMGRTTAFSLNKTSEVDDMVFAFYIKKLK